MKTTTYRSTEGWVAVQYTCKESNYGSLLPQQGHKLRIKPGIFLLSSTCTNEILLCSQGKLPNAISKKLGHRQNSESLTPISFIL